VRDGSLKSRPFLIARSDPVEDDKTTKNVSIRCSHEEATASIQNAAQVIESPVDVDIGNIDVPVLERLLPLRGRFGFPPG
jgi:hypothetical protein